MRRRTHRVAHVYTPQYPHHWTHSVLVGGANCKADRKVEHVTPVESCNWRQIATRQSAGCAGGRGLVDGNRIIAAVGDVKVAEGVRNSRLGLT